jgi:hypothetical protein
MRPDFLIANVRLGAFNGLHLAHLAQQLGLKTRCILYGLVTDIGLAREAGAVGAWFEPACTLLPGLSEHVRSASTSDLTVRPVSLSESTRRSADRASIHPAPRTM